MFEKSGEPILSLRDEVKLFFRTNRPEGLLFYTGRGLSYMTSHEQGKTQYLFDKRGNKINSFGMTAVS